MRRLVAIATLALLVACSHSASDGGGGLRPGVTRLEEPLPTLEGPAVGGGSFDATRFDGKVLVLNVWATWCDPCRREQPALQRVFRRYRDRGVAFAGIDYRDDGAAAEAWIRHYGVTYPSLSDPNGKTAHDLGFPALPDTYVVDSSGRIRFQVFGETDEDELSNLIDRVLGIR